LPKFVAPNIRAARTLKRDDFEFYSRIFIMLQGILDKNIIAAIVLRKLQKE
jgi:hypothetical protein